LTTMLANVVNSLENLEAIVPVAQNLGARHVDYGVTSEQYDYVGEALLWTMIKSFGSDFTSEHYKAWEKAYTVLSSVMIEAAEVKKAI